jgi:hypothetical protein
MRQLFNTCHYTTQTKEEKMPTITLVQAAAHAANHIHLMTALPMNVNLTNLAGGAIQFSCSNLLHNIKAAQSVAITYDGAVGGGMRQYR